MPTWPALAGRLPGSRASACGPGTETRCSASEVVQEGDDGQPGLGDRAKFAARRPFEPVVEDRIAEKGLEAGSDIGAVVLEAVEAVRRFVLSPSIHDHTRLSSRNDYTFFLARGGGPERLNGYSRLASCVSVGVWSDLVGPGSFIVESILTLSDAKARFSEIVEKAVKGEEFVVTRMGKPVVRIVPFRNARSAAQARRPRRRIRMSEDFDDWPPDLQDALGVAEPR